MITIAPKLFAEMSGPESAIVLKALEKSRVKQDELMAQGLSEDELDVRVPVLVASIVFHISSGLRRIGYDDARIVGFLWNIMGPFMESIDLPRPTAATIFQDPEGAN